MRTNALGILCSVFCTMCDVVADSGSIGLVLSGGGAKGAYEVGVWQVLEETGIASNIKAISGTSVGALNAALFATWPDAAETLWLENMESVFVLNTNRVAGIFQKAADDVSGAISVADETSKAWKGWLYLGASLGLRFVSDYVEITQTDAPRKGLIDSSRLVTVLDASLPADWPADVPVVYATAMEKNTWTAKTWKLNGEPHERRILMIRASTAIPEGFDTVSIDGNTYVDGGWEGKGGDNLPIKPVLDNHPEIKTVVVVHLDDAEHLSVARRDRVRAAATAAGVRLVEIVPSEDIGGVFGWQGVFDASPDTATHLIELGRKDAREKLREARLAD